MGVFTFFQKRSFSWEQFCKNLFQARKPSKTAIGFLDPKRFLGRCAATWKKYMKENWKIQKILGFFIVKPDFAEEIIGLLLLREFTLRILWKIIADSRSRDIPLPPPNRSEGSMATSLLLHVRETQLAYNSPQSKCLTRSWLHLPKTYNIWTDKSGQSRP